MARRTLTAVRNLRLGGRRTPIKVKKRKAVAIEEAKETPQEKRIKARTQRTIKRRTSAPTPPPRRRKTIAAKPTTRTIEVDILAKPPQSIRGSYKEGTERFVDSIIIHLILYDAPERRLHVQFTAAGNWQHYTYFNVPLNVADAFENAPSKGRFFNKNIRNTKEHGFHYNYAKGNPRGF